MWLCAGEALYNREKCWRLSEAKEVGCPGWAVYSREDHCVAGRITGGYRPGRW
jgi:hypothetical protein